ncbi:UDP-glucose 4-epimerase GalE [Citrobacter sp. ANG330]|uniref:UDP-glucose 4-epimerase GalE n=1 Tax=Citrobacter sp. ANG330 TaxID=3048142 RepID=UPI0039C28FC1
MSILVTGGCGYIGIHTVYSLVSQGHSVIVLDNFSNSTIEPLRRVESMTGQNITFYEGDSCCEKTLENIFSKNNVTAVIHFAGLKSIGESIKKPVEYYVNNVSGTLTLLKCMIKNNVNNFIFSSSATVYGKTTSYPISESTSIGGTTNPYGSSKLFMELMLNDISQAHEQLKITILRYFNPIGAHESGNIGEQPNGIPNNLMPYLTQVAIGSLPYLNVYGFDYPTPDGTGVRDYIHVMDLAEAHVQALSKISSSDGLQIYNLGTGKGYSVLEIINTFESVTGIKIPYKLVPRRKGDIAECWSDSSKANIELGWKAKRGIIEMIRDAWKWQSDNPNGYGK